MNEGKKKLQVSMQRKEAGGDCTREGRKQKGNESKMVKWYFGKTLCSDEK